MAALHGPLSHVRFELFFKDPSGLRALLPFLRAHGIQRVNLPNKNQGDDLVSAVRDLQAAGIRDVCVHYSVKNQLKKNTLEAGHAHLSDFMQQVGQQAETSGRTGGGEVSILLVTGSGKKKAFNTVSALESLASPGQVHETEAAAAELKGSKLSSSKRKRPLIPDQPASTRKTRSSSECHGVPSAGGTSSCSGEQCRPPIFVAFNPYLPDPADAEQERLRLCQKLQTGLPAGVYLQVQTCLQRTIPIYLQVPAFC
jgi:hypothetical protein